MKASLFILPGIVSILFIAGLAGVPFCLLTAIAIGVCKIVIDSARSIAEGRYSLDYIAFAAMVMSLLTGEYIAGAVIAFMFTGGEALEAYASARAHDALKTLSETIPKVCLVRRGSIYEEEPIQEVKEGQIILVKRSEIIPLDGTISSKGKAILNLANLTGEAEAVTRETGMFVKSGSVNAGESLELKVVGNFSSSTYHKIALLVEDAKINPARTVRLSEQANWYFTAATFLIATVTYLASGDIDRVLSVLVIATPCPLIIAAPVAFVSGMSRTARAGIIIRKPAAFEAIAKATVVFFDKTGTLTLGEPVLTEVEITSKNSAVKSIDDALRIAAGIEIHSLHPLARTLVAEATKREIAFPVAGMVRELIGKGIAGSINGKTYSISRAENAKGAISLSLLEGTSELARFHFADVLKEGAVELLAALKARGIRAVVITGDKKENAKRVFKGTGIEIFAEQSPEDKHRLIDNAKKKGETVVMVGDGINDAPALARADVGIVFSGTENGVSIEAADVAVLGHGIEKLFALFLISRRTVSVARESIYGGIGLSTIGMLFAAFGYLPPISGALIQEGIDVIVILNALRALRG